MQSKRTGLYHAFDTAKAEAAFGSRLLAAERSAPAHVSRPVGITPMSTISGCPNLTYGMRLYADSNCGGSHLGFNRTDAVARLSDYGWNDQASSIDLENSLTCIIIATLYNKANYDTSAGVVQYYGANGTCTAYNLDNANFNDKASSVKTQCS
jgi:hypothetical protein